MIVDLNTGIGPISNCQTGLVPVYHLKIHKKLKYQQSPLHMIQYWSVGPINMNIIL